MTDLDKARRIVATREQWVAEPGDLEEIIAIAVAEGIALGRKEGLAIAVASVNQESTACGATLITLKCVSSLYASQSALFHRLPGNAEHAIPFTD